jgi:hypothetical protein
MRSLRVAALILGALAAGVPRASAQAHVLAWNVRYGYGAFPCGGTTLDVDADRDFSLVSTRCGRPRAELHGMLAADAVQRIGDAIAATQSQHWSAWYLNGCVEHYPQLWLARREPDGTTPSISVRWGCGLTGVPADLRALIVVLSSEAQALVPDALLDTVVSREAIPVSKHAALSLLTPNEVVRRTVDLAADGAVLARSRVSKLLYPVADCPAGSFAPIDAPTLAKLHALETPAATISPSTSAATQEVFDRVMADCPAPKKSYDAPELLVPTDVRWIVSYVRAPTVLPSMLQSRSITVDNQGRYQLHVGAANGAGTLGPSAAHVLDVAVAVASESRWEASYVNGSGDCAAGLQLVRVVSPTTRRGGPFVDLSCGADGAPADLRAVEHAAGALLERLAP